MYDLSVTIVHTNQPDVKTNSSLPVYYYSSSDLSLTAVIPDEVLIEDLPQYVTLVGSDFFNWTETVCYFGSQESNEVIFINDTHLECIVSAAMQVKGARFIYIFRLNRFITYLKNLICNQ